MNPRHRAPGRRRATDTTGPIEIAGGPEPTFSPPEEYRRSRPARERYPEEGQPFGGRPRRAMWGRTIRAKLALILSVPTVLLVALAGFGVINQFRVAGDASDAADNVELVLATQDLIHSFQQERGLTSGLLGGAAHYRSQVDAQRRASNQNRVRLDRLLARADSPSAQAVRGALTRLNTLGAIRASVDAGQLDRSEMLDFYTAAIVALSTASADGNVGQHDLELRRGLEALHALGDAKEAIALERGQLNGVFAQGRFTQDDYIRFTETRATKLGALAKFGRLATAQRAASLQAAQRTPQATLAAEYERYALGGASGRRLNRSPPRWTSAMATVGYDLRAVQRDISEDIRVRAQQVKGDADLLLTLYAVTAAITFLIALLLWLYTFRSIVRPLQVLTSEAHEAAENKLPRAVAQIQAAAEPGEAALDSSHSKLARREDEFAEVAGALDHLQQTALRLAVEQAVMRRNTAESLANLGRRNQNLVRRQLGFISALEREEADPNALANLFELDHLATRMRRNAESLLILVGEHSPRRWSGAVEVGDVLRSAFAEVEDYRRVILRRADNALVQGAAAAEISHLLAELVENALSFSPPDREVEVQARSTGSQYHIAIVDQGVGMSPEALATANARLRGEESFLVTPTRDLGHYVVGRLAQRLGVQVWLHDSPLNGVTARIVLPGNLLVESEKKPVAAPPGKARPPQANGNANANAQAQRPRQADPVTGPPKGHVTHPFPTTGTAGTAVAADPTSAPTSASTPTPLSAPPREPTPPPPPTPTADAGPTTIHDGGGMATTRNGLVKRQPRESTLRRPARPSVPPQVPAAEEERSPGEVRSMLNAFRSGVHRAEQNRTGEPQ